MPTMPRAIALVGALLLGCGPDPDEVRDAAPDVERTEDPAIALGTGQLTYEPLPPDGTLELVHGSEGEVHLELALALYGLDANGLRLRYEGIDEGTGESIFQPFERSLTEGDVLDEGDRLVRAGDRLVLEETRVDRTAILGRPIRIRATVLPPDHSLLTDAVTVTVVGER